MLLPIKYTKQLSKYGEINLKIHPKFEKIITRNKKNCKFELKLKFNVYSILMNIF